MSVEGGPMGASKYGAKLELHHVDALSSDETPDRLFDLRLQRDALRVETIYSHVSKAVARQHPRAPDGRPGFCSSVIFGLAQGSGEYFMRLGVGTPPRYLYMVLDTGSDVIWVQCSPFKKCYSQTDLIFDPTKSRSLSGILCGSPLCRSLDSSGCNHCRMCLYKVSYGDGSVTFARHFTTLLGISVGGTCVPKIRPSLFKMGRDDNGGIIIDSGTSVTRLTRPAYISLRDAFLFGASNLKRAPAFLIVRHLV
ncbi:cyclic pyranopterin monophosphate synthase accessory protein [Hibiscus syriacus]|uniref:Cyclic pyranopterin monophosphate synthase accessory protein n=1 Tax=Hibiscus syriacus TaxID=106335 RepID=A0A6A3AAM0_HIBSY|nr:cyclic pyranopterin monophosphate synthase accessory protein [Hibiscus syriacus]